MLAFIPKIASKLTFIRNQRWYDSINTERNEAAPFLLEIDTFPILVHLLIRLAVLVLYYAPSIFLALGLSSNATSLLATGVVGVAMTLATIPTVLYIDRVGRRPFLLAGAVGMAFCHFTISVIFARNEHTWSQHKAAGWAAVAMVWLFVIFFGSSWGPCVSLACTF